LPETEYFADGKLTAAGKAAGWRRVSFKGHAGGDIALLTKGNAPWFESERDYRDFHLKLEFKLARMANSGIFLRAVRGGGNPAFSGCEIQLLDDFNWEKVTGSKLQPWQFTGSLYGAVAPRPKNALRPLGEWNSCEIVYRGSRLVTALNGRVLYDVDTFALDVKPPFRERAQAGFIGLQRHAPKQVEGEAYAWFRNVFVRELR
jgi:hypothetical protein